MPPISIKDYAKQKGVTYEAIRKQISRYKNEELQNLRDENNNLLKQTVALLNENKALIEKAGQIKLLEADNEAKAQKLADAEKSAQSANLKLSEATKAFEDKEQQLQAEIEQLRQQLESEKQRPLTLRERFFGRKN